MARRPKPIPDDVAALSVEFACWRRQREHMREPIPAELLDKAAALARIHTSNVVARGLRCDRRRLRALVEARSKTQRTARAAEPSMVRLQPIVVAPPTRSGTAAVEIENRAGDKLRLSGADVTTVIRAFLGGDR